MALVNVKQASDHLRLGINFGTDFDPADFDPDDYASVVEMPDLLDKIAQAEAIIRDYLKVENVSPEWEPATERQAEVVRAAVLLVLGSLWAGREDGVGADADILAQNGAVARLLRRQRDPAFA
jgi:hypothetical protein